jgi:hypothetical protein
MIDMLGGGEDALEPVSQRMKKTPTNKDFLATLNKDTL